MEEKDDITLLKKKLEALEAENKLLSAKLKQFNPTGNTVSVPDPFRPLFDKAESIVKEYFSEFKANPTEGSIKINDERYVLMRASSLSVDFFQKIQSLYSDKGEAQAFHIGRNFLFDISHVMGSADAKNFHFKMNLDDPISKLSAGPIHFAYSGWAFVDILPESNPSPDENFFLKYHHPYSFEADSWLDQNEKVTEPVCIMNAGYSSGWCEESFGIPLTAVEVSCRAKGDKHCTFIMAPPSKIKEYLSKETTLIHQEKGYDIPLFFERKKAEDKIAASLKEKEMLLKELHHRVKNNLQIISSFLNLQSNYLPDTASIEMFNATKNRVKTIALVHEKLYQSEDVEHVHLAKYIQSIIELLEETVSNQILITTDVDLNLDLKVHIDVAIPCGLILNELVSNAIKHAFDEREDGKIEIAFTQEAIGYQLSVCDNGKGVLPNFDFNNTNSLGLVIVTSLVEQMDWNLQVISNKGCSFNVIMPFETFSQND
jgi:two-component sensor histidine kinase